MDISYNFSRIKAVINNRAKLIAVSKNQTPEKIALALESGHRIFGENKVQEAQSHWQEMRVSYPDLELHLIGPLQTNKAKDAVALFDVIQTVDREKLVDALVREEEKQQRALRYFIQVNTGAEDQKAGVGLKDFSTLLHYAQKRLQIKGLMCIPPVGQDPVPHFHLLKKMAQENGLRELSMGMSGDYEIAIACGATCVRIGTALFGER